MSDDEEGGEDPWASSAAMGTMEGEDVDVARAEDDDGFELLEETKFDPRLHKPGAMIMAAAPPPRGPQARNTKRNAEAQIKAAAQAKHSRVEADQLFPWRDDHPQDPRIMGVDYVVVNEVTYFCNVNLWVLLYRQAQTGQPVM
jgi:hypothetical protein